jgi:8-oxo-dGTP pyrophosphatase MutT (NUDIX family)
LAHHPGQISFPGGRRDRADASAADTALREAEEEVGVDRDLVEVLGYLDDFHTGTGFSITPVLGIIDPSATFAASRHEVEHIFEIPLDYALDPTHYRQVSSGEPERRRSYFVIEYADHHVWGATAGILVNLRDKARTMTQYVHFLDGDH